MCDSCLLINDACNVREVGSTVYVKSIFNQISFDAIAQIELNIVIVL